MTVLSILEHATAWPKNYRRHYVAGPQHPSWPFLMKAVSFGYIKQVKVSFVPQETFLVTDAGRAFLRAKLGPPDQEWSE